MTKKNLIRTSPFCSHAQMFGFRILIAATAWMALSAEVFAMKFSNQFIEFELPPRWSCVLEGAEWVCQTAEDSKKKEAVIILAAKLKGPQDSLDQYQEFLKKPKTFKSVQGRPVKSDAKYAKNININSHAWIDALHMESEVPGFYTRYLATVKQDIGVLVTYSIHKSKYQSYIEPFEALVKTLRVNRVAGAPINSLGARDSNLFATGVPSQISESTVFGGAQPQGGADGSTQATAPKKNDDWLLYAGIGAAALLFLFMRRKKSDS